MPLAAELQLTHLLVKPPHEGGKHRSGGDRRNGIHRLRKRAGHHSALAFGHCCNGFYGTGLVGGPQKVWHYLIHDGAL